MNISIELFSDFGVMSQNGDYEKWIWKILSDGFVFFYGDSQFIFQKDSFGV